MTGVIYFLIILFATFVGSSAGIGGGVIIKPSLDALNISDIGTIAFISSCSVFTMAIYSSTKRIKDMKNFDFKTVSLIGIGSIIGGNIGNKLFLFFVKNYDVNVVKAVQPLVLSLLLVLVLLNSVYEFKSYKVENKGFIFFIGFLLGTVSSFLGIGGGPINVAVFTVLFSYDIKTAGLYSLVTIIFTQLSSLTTMYITNGFQDYDLKLLYFALPSALLGGYLGTKFNKKVSEETINKLFRTTLVGVIILNVYNFVVAFQNL